MNQFTKVSCVCVISLVFVLLIGVPASIAQITDKSDDKDVLVTLYYTTKGDSWRNNDGWLSDAPISEWYGVTVRRGRVVEINLSYNNLSGDLPNELARLTQLKTLDLRWNALSGHLPDLGDFHKATTLLLTDNQFSGSIPAWIGDLEALERLDLSHNQFEGDIPAEIGMLRSLRSLAIHHNNLSGPIPSQMGDAEALRRLILNDNALTGAIPKELGSIEFLRHLNLSNNDLSGNVPIRVSLSKTMEWMDLSDNTFDQDDTPVLRHAVPDYDEYWGDLENSRKESTLANPGRQLDPMVLNMWAQTSEDFEEPASRAFTFESLKPLAVRDGVLHVSEDRMRELVRDSDLLRRVAKVNAYLKESTKLITSANDLERLFKVILTTDDSDESLEEILNHGGTRIGKVRLSSWYPSRDDRNIIKTKSKYSLIASNQDAEIQVALELRLFRISDGLLSSLPVQKAVQTPPLFPHDQDFIVYISTGCDNGWYYTVFRSRFLSRSGRVTPDNLMLKTRRVYVSGCW